MMEKYFDNLNMQAMVLVDDELANIAETEEISNETAQRIADLTLQKAGFAPSHKPAIGQKSGISRMGIILLSAALAAAVMGVTVSGYMRYNQKLVEKNFGILGTRHLEDMNLPEPVRYTNGTVNMSLEAVLCDGEYALILSTMEAAQEGRKIDWENSYYAYESSMEDPDYPGQTLYCYDNAIQYYRDYQIIDDQCWVTWVYEIQEDAEDAMTLHFYHGDTIGIEVDIPLVQNIPVLTLTSENGETLFLSGYQIYGKSYNSISGSEFELYRKDGSHSTCYIPSIKRYGGRDESGVHGKCYAKLYEGIEGVEFDRNDPSTFIGYLDVSDVEYITLDGTNYYVQNQ